MGEQSIHVLLVDDDAVDAELTRRALRGVDHPRFVVERAASLAEALEFLADSTYEVVLLDLSLPDSPRGETVPRLRAANPSDVPIIVLTGLDDDESAMMALDMGAQDYLGKDDVTSDTLARSIRHAVQRHQLLKQVHCANAQLEQKNERLAQLYDLAQQFVENVSHEFRTPLTVIREFTSIVMDGLAGPVSPKQAEHLQKVLHRTDDLALMVDDMLDISKLEAGLLGVWRRPCRVEDMVETVRSLVKGRADTRRINFRTEVDGNLPIVYCDEEKARRVIVNLAVNAIKFTPEGGAVEIWARAAGDEVTIGVTDTGPGLSAENLSIIFERFRQVDQGLRASTKGFGLGLNIAKELVALNLGQITVDSEVGAGSTFSFTLPQYDPQTLLERYLRRIESQVGAELEVSLIAVQVDLEKHAAAVPVVDEFLQRSVRANDLVGSYEDGRWIIVAACPSCASERLTSRLSTEWAKYLRNAPNVELPPLEFDVQRTYGLSRQHEALVQDYLALARRSGVHAGQDPDHPTVLVVDDDTEVSQCLGVRLEAAGFRVLAASDGEEGLQVAKSRHPDAVVLDVRMPKKDGMEVLRELRRDPAMSKKPIVMLSASVRDQNQAIEAGANFFVLKPYESTEVLSALETSLQQEMLA